MYRGVDRETEGEAYKTKSIRWICIAPQIEMEISIEINLGKEFGTATGQISKKRIMRFDWFAKSTTSSNANLWGTAKEMRNLSCSQTVHFWNISFIKQKYIKFWGCSFMRSYFIEDSCEILKSSERFYRTLMEYELKANVLQEMLI